ncbi:MAG: nuclear transport factor 2 family protein [Gemmatimonadota bacterium]
MRAAVGLLTGLSGGCAVDHGRLAEAQVLAIRDSVRTAIDGLQRHFAAAQWDSVTRIYADDPSFRWLEDGRVVARSAAEIRQYFAKMPAGTRIETTYHDTEILPIVPGVASVVTNFQTHMSDSTADPGFTFGGILTMTFVHRDDGWRILNGHASAPRPRSP